jgi:hypothetical protein
VPETAGADAGFGNAGEGCPRPSAYVCLRQQGQRGTKQLAERTRAVTGDLCGCTGARRDITRTPRFDAKELGEIDMVSRALAMLDLG